MNLLARYRAWLAWPKYWEDRAKCYVFGHDYNPWTHAFMCSRCARGDRELVESGDRTLPERIHQLRVWWHS
jgi:hypothetical protein